MNKHFASFEDVVADEDFFAWRYGTDAVKAEAWQHWLAAHPEYLPVVEEAIQYLDAIALRDKPMPAQQTEAAHTRLMTAVDAAETPVVPMRKRRAWMWMAAAAAVLVAAVIGYQVLAVKDVPLVLAAPYGQLQKHTLPDGSVVTLNANSKISLEKEWTAGETREVWLEGEAFFEVAKTPGKTGFVVHAKGMDVIVTGTRFNVLSRATERSVLLTEGSVTLKTEEGKELQMTPGEFVKLAEKEPKKMMAAQDKVLAWKEAKLVFDDTPMSEVADMIQQHYGIAVQLSNGLSAETITGILPNNNLDALLAALEAAKGFQITRIKEGIIIANASIF